MKNTKKAKIDYIGLLEKMNELVEQFSRTNRETWIAQRAVIFTLHKLAVNNGDFEEASNLVKLSWQTHYEYIRDEYHNSIDEE